MLHRIPARHTLLVVALVLGLVAPAQALTPRQTAGQLAAQMSRAGAGSGAYVVDLDSGEAIYTSRRARKRMPASVEKLFTTTTALLRLGPGTRLRTDVASTDPVGLDGVLHGDLHLRGGGDPTLTSADLRALAADLVEDTGLTKVTGRVLGDESAFDRLRGVPSSGYALSVDIGAPIGALMVDRGRTGGVNPYYQPDPAAWAAGVFAAALRDNGVKAPKARVGAATSPAAAVPLAAHDSPTIAQLITLTNVPSDNYMAETLLKVLGASTGRQGTTARGAAVVEQTLEDEFGVHPTVVDGSGLSRSDRTSPGQVVSLLRQVAERAEGPTLQASLAVAGRSGTLEDRMRSSVARDRCRGKTGTLRDVSNLAGFCTTKSGDRVVFAILMNRVYPTSARVLQDRMVGTIARYVSAG